MIVKMLENFQKGKIKIYLEDVEDDYSSYIDSSGYFCFLYTKELAKYKIKEEKELSIENFKKILENQKTRTTNKAEAILSRVNKTKKGLFDKLVFDGYNRKISEEIVEKMVSYGYVNDELFARNYIDDNKKRKSIKAIRMNLIQKGINKELLDEILEEESDTQEDLVKSLIDKKLKGRNWESLDYKEKAKIKAYIYSKGFKFPGSLD